MKVDVSKDRVGDFRNNEGKYDCYCNIKCNVDWISICVSQIPCDSDIFSDVTHLWTGKPTELVEKDKWVVRTITVMNN